MFCSPQLRNAQHMPKIFFSLPPLCKAPVSQKRLPKKRRLKEAGLLCIAVKQLRTAKRSQYTIQSKSYQHDFDMPQTAATLNMYKPNPSCQLHFS